MCETAAMNGFTTGRLFEPHTQYFNDKVWAEAIDVFGNENEIWAWIGINDKGGPWVYTSSGTDLKFPNWQPGQPNSNGAHHCVHFWWGGVFGKWGDYPCNDKLFFICEFV